MPKNTPFTVVREFLDRLRKGTRHDAMFHIITNHSGDTVLGIINANFSPDDIEVKYDEIFSDMAANHYSYLGKILALRSFLDFYVWSFIDEYKSKQHYMIVEKLKEDTATILKASWDERKNDLMENLVQWESLKAGPLSNEALDAYSQGLWRDAARIPVAPP
jgi:hypothetical protein